MQSSEGEAQLPQRDSNPTGSVRSPLQGPTSPSQRSNPLALGQGTPPPPGFMGYPVPYAGVPEVGYPVSILYLEILKPVPSAALAVEGSFLVQDPTLSLLKRALTTKGVGSNPFRDCWQSPSCVVVFTSHTGNGYKSKSARWQHVHKIPKGTESGSASTNQAVIIIIIIILYFRREGTTYILSIV